MWVRVQLKRPGGTCMQAEHVRRACASLRHCTIAALRAALAAAANAQSARAPAKQRQGIHTACRGCTPGPPVATTPRHRLGPPPPPPPRPFSLASVAPASVATTAEGLQVPHGGKLVNLMAPADQVAALKAACTKTMELSDRNACDVELLCVGCAAARPGRRAGCGAARSAALCALRSPAGGRTPSRASRAAGRPGSAALHVMLRPARRRAGDMSGRPHSRWLSLPLRRRH